MNQFISDKDLLELPDDRYHDFKNWCLSNGHAIAGISLEESEIDSQVLLLYLRDIIGTDYGLCVWPHEEDWSVTYWDGYNHNTIIRGDSPLSALWSACKLMMGMKT